MRNFPRRGRDGAQRRLRSARRQRRAGRLLQPRDALLRGPLERRLRQVLERAPRPDGGLDPRRHCAASPRGQAPGAAVPSITASTATARESSSRIGSEIPNILTLPGSKNGKFVRQVARAAEHPLAAATRGGPRPVAASHHDARNSGPRGLMAVRGRYDRAAVREPVERTPVLQRPRLSARRDRDAMHDPGRRLARRRVWTKNSITSAGAAMPAACIRPWDWSSAGGNVYVLGRDQITRLARLERRRRSRFL